MHPVSVRWFLFLFASLERSYGSCFLIFWKKTNHVLRARLAESGSADVRRLIQDNGLKFQNVRSRLRKSTHPSCSRYSLSSSRSWFLIFFLLFFLATLRRRWMARWTISRDSS